MSPSQNNTVAIGDDEATLRAATREQAIDAIVGKRTNQWKAVIEAELQDLITQAASIRQNINGAKTNTKKVYFEKKFNKVSVQVRQMITALQRVNSTATETTATNQNESPTAE